MNLEISVVISNYNYAEYIEEAVQSVLSQRYPIKRVEIIVVDDGSTDDSLDRLARFGSSITVLRQAHGGQAAALNAGCAAASGEVLVFLDADDYLHPDRLRLVYEEFTSSPNVVAVMNRREFVGLKTSSDPELGFRNRSWSPEQGDLLYAAFVSTSAIAVRTTAMQRILPIPAFLHICADMYIWSIIKHGPISLLPQALTSYRIHPCNCFERPGESLAPKRHAYYQLGYSLLLHSLSGDFSPESVRLARDATSFIERYLRQLEAEAYPENVRDARWSMMIQEGLLMKYSWESLSRTGRAIRTLRAFTKILLGPTLTALISDHRPKTS